MTKVSSTYKVLEHLHAQSDSAKRGTAGASVERNCICFSESALRPVMHTMEYVKIDFPYATLYMYTTLYYFNLQLFFSKATSRTIYFKILFLMHLFVSLDENRKLSR